MLLPNLGIIGRHRHHKSRLELQDIREIMVLFFFRKILVLRNPPTELLFDLTQSQKKRIALSLSVQFPAPFLPLLA